SSLLHATLPPRSYTLSLHDALPILALAAGGEGLFRFDLREFTNDNARYKPANLSDRDCTECNWVFHNVLGSSHLTGGLLAELTKDRKSTRLNSSHLGISYAVFCLKK